MAEEELNSSSSTTVPMRAEFPAWMHEFQLGPDDDARQRRWDGIIAVADGAGKEIIEPLVRVAFKSAARAKPNPSALSAIIETFREHDPERPVDPGGREFEVLAAVCLVVLIDGDDSDIATATALAVATASVCGARKPDLPVDMAAVAEKGLRELSETNSRRPDFDDLPEVAPLNFDAAVKQYQAAPNPDGFAASLKMVAQITTNALKTVANGQQQVLEDTAKVVAMQDEELQMLWWLIGGRSFDLECPFADVAAEARTLIMAKELADFTNIVPGPASIKGLLSRAMVGDAKTPIHKAVIATEHDAFNWLNALEEDSIAGEDMSPVTLPVHLAIKRQLETGRGETWVAGWAGAAGIPEGFACSQLQLAEHFYRERLLLAALRS